MYDVEKIGLTVGPFLVAASYASFFMHTDFSALISYIVIAIAAEVVLLYTSASKRFRADTKI
ncbi:MAG: hypothetical protein FWD81_04330 [Methanomassiliicoccaceae archaeon]|nr:hypothetical protein [Methanomassiliicoccaceae archaeon]